MRPGLNIAVRVEHLSSWPAMYPHRREMKHVKLLTRITLLYGCYHSCIMISTAVKGADSWVPRQSETLEVRPNGGPLLRLTCDLDGVNPLATRVDPVNTRGQSEQTAAVGRDLQPGAAPGSCESLAAAISQLLGERE